MYTPKYEVFPGTSLLFLYLNYKYVGVHFLLKSNIIFSCMKVISGHKAEGARVIVLAGRALAYMQTT